MNMKFKSTEAGTPGNILQFPDHYVCVAQLFEKDSALAVVVDGRKIVKGGTIFPANDKTAQGIVFQDYDVTDGDQNGALMVHGFVNTAKLPVAPTNGAKLALKNIEFFPIVPAEYGGAIQIADVTVSPEGGNFVGSQEVTLACETPNSVIFYTLDGSEPVPGAEGTLQYSEPFTVTSTKTVKAKAFGDPTLMLPSANIVSKAFSQQAATPVADPDGGEFETTVDVELTCATPGVKIYYTNDGSTPTADKTEYTGAITLTDTKTIKAIAIKEGLVSSAILTKVFTKAS